MDNEIDRKIDVTAIPFLLVQSRQQTHDWTVIGSGADGLGIQECSGHRIENLLKGTAILTTKNLVNIRSVTSAKFLHGLFQRKQMILYGRQS